MSAHDEQQAKILELVAVEADEHRNELPALTFDEIAEACRAGAAALRRASKDQSVEIALLKAENAELRGKIAEREQC